jgi:hypothetical protein
MIYVCPISYVTSIGILTFPTVLNPVCAQDARMRLSLVGNRPESQHNAFLKVTLVCRRDVIPSLRDTYEVRTLSTKLKTLRPCIELRPAEAKNITMSPS